jgi:hypothetical protein
MGTEQRLCLSSMEATGVIIALVTMVRTALGKNSDTEDGLEISPVGSDPC